MGYITLAKRIMNDELSHGELIENLDSPSVDVLQPVMLKLVQHDIKSDDVCRKLVRYSRHLEPKFKILASCRIGHLAICSLKRLGYQAEYQETYKGLSDKDKEIVDKMEKAI